MGKCATTCRCRVPALSAILLTAVAWRAVTGQSQGNGSGHGSWAITGIEYRNEVSHYALSSKLLKTHYIRERVASSALAVLECTKACLSTSGCVSFVHNPPNRRCFLTKSDRCATPSDLLFHSVDHHTYEIKSDGDPNKDVTCLASCRAAHTCGECGRTQCQGSLCDQCNNACWLIDPLVNGVVGVFVTLSTRENIVCSGVWQRVWNGRFQLYSQLFSSPLKLKVTLRYKGEQHDREAYFASVSFHHDRMSVGEYTEGDAGNGWDAPFTERRADSVEESNCRPFFYDEDRPCSANGVMPYEEQFALNYTTIDRGFYWGTENETLANTEISYIRLFVTTIYL